MLQSISIKEMCENSTILECYLTYEKGITVKASLSYWMLISAALTIKGIRKLPQKGGDIHKSHNHSNLNNSFLENEDSHLHTYQKFFNLNSCVATLTCLDHVCMTGLEDKHAFTSDFATLLVNHKGCWYNL